MVTLFLRKDGPPLRGIVRRGVRTHANIVISQSTGRPTVTTAIVAIADESRTPIVTVRRRIMHPVAQGVVIGIGWAIKYSVIAGLRGLQCRHAEFAVAAEEI